MEAVARRNRPGGPGIGVPVSCYVQSMLFTKDDRRETGICTALGYLNLLSAIGEPCTTHVCLFWLHPSFEPSSSKSSVNEPERPWLSARQRREQE
jgi:hypothetical protein